MFHLIVDLQYVRGYDNKILWDEYRFVFRYFLRKINDYIICYLYVIVGRFTYTDMNILLFNHLSSESESLIQNKI